MPTGRFWWRTKQQSKQLVADQQTRLGSAPGRLSANRLHRSGGIRPISLDETLPVQSEPRHLFAEGAAGNVEPLHHTADLAASLRKRALDQRALERIDLLGEREFRFLGL